MEAEALRWLLEPADPPIKMFTLTDILGKPQNSEEVRIAREGTLSYRPVLRLKRAQGGRGYWPPDDSCHTPKFTATVWQLMLLGEMGIPRTPWIESAIERFLAQHQMENGAFSWKSHLGRGKVEEEVCLTGNMVRTLIVFGHDEDRRVKKALDWLPEFQLEDGGWNCDYPKYDVEHSSFMSTIEPLWAYSEIPRSRWTRRLKGSVERGAEFLLMHRLFKAHHDWRPVELRHMNTVFTGSLVTKFHFPMYYYYDALHALRVLTRLGFQDDERISDAIHLLLSKKTPEGKWLLEGDWIRERTEKTRKTLVTIEQLMKPSKWVTLNSYRVLAKTGELKLPH
ncbi:MAG: hypothetical protein E6K90_03105 [Thaumarchaeota archaeon]|nr:MAG: hypothetical protein E6K90_03105 [Nitrososphaerota archaeon]